MLKLWTLIFTVTGLFAQPAAADTTLVATKIKDMEACLDTLEEFNWVCQEFNHGVWVRIYDHSYWERGHLLFYQDDIEGDGIEGAILKLPLEVIDNGDNPELNLVDNARAGWFLGYL